MDSLHRAVATRSGAVHGVRCASATRRLRTNAPPSSTATSTQAAIRAGYSPKTAQQQSSRLLSNVVVRAAIIAGKTERHTESVMFAVEALERA